MEEVTRKALYNVPEGKGVVCVCVCVGGGGGGGEVTLIQVLCSFPIRIRYYIVLFRTNFDRV